MELGINDLLPFSVQGRCALVLYQPRHASIRYVERRHGRCGTQPFLLRRAPLTAKLGKLHLQRLWICAVDPE